MTNYDYIMSKMTDRNLADIICNSRFIFDRDIFRYQIDKAFENWRDSIGEPCGSSYSLSKGDPKPNAFKMAEAENFDTGKWEQTGRNDSLSFQVWLSKQYDPKEWF